MMRSCYRGMPRDAKASLTVNATGEFITVHDYIFAVHPWLMGLREKILQASGDLLDAVALPSDTRLMVSAFLTPDVVTMVEEDEWKMSMAKKDNEKSAEWVGALREEQ